MEFTGIAAGNVLGEFVAVGSKLMERNEERGREREGINNNQKQVSLSCPEQSKVHFRLRLELQANFSRYTLSVLPLYPVSLSLFS